MGTISDLDKKIRAVTGFRSFQELLDAKGGYRPSIDMGYPGEHGAWLAEIADAYDDAMEARGDHRRAFRFGKGYRNGLVVQPDTVPAEDKFTLNDWEVET